MSVEEVLARVNDLSTVSPQGPPHDATSTPKLSLVELTGGEPLLQAEVIPLSQKLLDSGYRVMVETSGERPGGLRFHAKSSKSWTSNVRIQGSQTPFKWKIWIRWMARTRSNS